MDPETIPTMVNATKFVTTAACLGARDPVEAAVAAAEPGGRTVVARPLPVGDLGEDVAVGRLLRCGVTDGEEPVRVEAVDLAQCVEEAGACRTRTRVLEPLHEQSDR